VTHPLDPLHPKEHVMLLARRLVLVVTFAVLVSATAYGAGWASRRDAPTAPLPVPVNAPASETAPQRTAIAPAPALPAPGDQGPRVRRLQARLAQLDWYQPAPTAVYDADTIDAVRGFQAKRGLRATGTVDGRTLARLRAMTTAPTRAELHGVLGNRPGPLDERCTSGRVLCVDKSSRTLRWVVDGEVRQVLDTRFGRPGLETREGSFAVARMSRDHVSSLYDTSMPFAMFFSGGQAVHYSPDFAAVGYAGASHGCVNVRDREGIAWLFDQVRLGDRVVVYWS
jgi:peptidoglycan hydrolase-like protein with peptidoglycan-binding domain